MVSAAVCGSVEKHWYKERGSAEWPVELSSSKKEQTSNTGKVSKGEGGGRGGGQRA